jgi:hypothetical protein
MRDRDLLVASEIAETRVLSIVQSSALVRLLDRVLATVIAAWNASIADRLWPRGTDVRIAGSVTAIASATALVLQRLAARPAPLVWIVPALALIAGLCLIALSRARMVRRR